MYRPSTAFSTRPRESVFVSATLRHEDDSLSFPFIEACVTSAQESCDKLYDAQCSLRRGVSDFPRMMKILRNERLFVLINESHAETYRAQLSEETGPQIMELAERSEKGIKQLERRAALAKSKLDAARLSRDSAAPATAARKLDTLINERKTLQSELQKLKAEIEMMEGQLEK